MARKEQAAIPADWDGETWFCSQITWPESERWRAVLTGLVSLPSRGRYWAENTGTITLAQAVGREIFSRNVPFINCSNGEIIPTEATIIYRGGALIESEDDMGQVVTNVEVTEAGLLRVYFGPCCYEDYDLGALVGSGALKRLTSGSDAKELAGDESTTEDVACRKAAAIATALENVIAEVWEHKDVLYVGEAVRRTQRAYPDYTLSAAQLTVMSGTMSVLGLLDFALIITDDEWQNLICCWSKSLSDEYSLTHDEFVSLASCVKSAWLDLADPDESLAKFSLGLQGLNALGEGTLDDICRNAVAFTSEPDCRCVDEMPESWEEDYDWFKEYDLTTIANPYTAITRGDFSSGTGMLSETYGGGQLLQATIDPGLTAVGNTTVEFVRVEVAGTWAWPSGGSRAVINQPSGTSITIDDIVNGVGQWTGSVSVPIADLQIVHNLVSGSAMASIQRITRIIIAGSGTDPWAA